MIKISSRCKPVGFCLLGIIIGWTAFRLIYPTLAPTSPTIVIGDNIGQIVSLDISPWGTPNFLFKQNGHLPVILYPAVGDQAPLVTLLDGRRMSYQEFSEDFKSNTSDPYAHSIFLLDYQENDIDELGYVTSISEISK